MDFIITSEMKEYFKKITSYRPVHGNQTNYPNSPISNLFDFYYLSILVGLENNQKEYKNKKDADKDIEEDENTKNSIKSDSSLKLIQIPKNVQSSFYKYINAIYLQKEIKNQKVNTKVRSEILRFIEERYPIDENTNEVRPSSKTITDLNAYALGGFNYMKKNITQPQDLLIFFKSYFKLFKTN